MTAFRFYFHKADNGIVDIVYHEANEDIEVLNLKKYISSMLSANLEVFIYLSIAQVAFDCILECIIYEASIYILYGLQLIRLPEF